jgi:hypothetical protein
MNAVAKSQVPAVIESRSLSPQSGSELYRVSTDAAELCRAIVVATARIIGGRKYVQVEGWQAIALAHGCVASSGDVTQHPDGSISAIGRIIRIDTGTVMSSAEGYVGSDEPTWFGGTTGGNKVLPKRADYAIRAMAQTRAISRACRSAFAHVVVMMNAGLSTTPAEEVPDGGFDNHPGATIDDAPPRHEPPASNNTRPQRTVRELVRDKLFVCATAEDVHAVAELPAVKRALKEAPDSIKEEIGGMLADALGKFMNAVDDGSAANEPEFMPGDE